MALRIFEMQVKIGSVGLLPFRKVPFVAKQSLTPSGTSAQSTAFNASTHVITVQADEAVVVEIAANPTADASSYKMAAGDEKDFSVEPGHKLAVKTA